MTQPLTVEIPPLPDLSDEIVYGVGETQSLSFFVRDFNGNMVIISNRNYY